MVRTHLATSSAGNLLYVTNENLSEQITRLKNKSDCWKVYLNESRLDVPYSDCPQIYLNFEINPDIYYDFLQTNPYRIGSVVEEFFKFMDSKFW